MSRQGLWSLLIVTLQPRQNLSQVGSNSSRLRVGTLHPQASMGASYHHPGHSLTLGNLWSMAWYGCLQQKPSGWAWTTKEGRQDCHAWLTLLGPHCHNAQRRARPPSEWPA